MQKDSKVFLFEEMPIPSAVMKLCIPTVLSSLVMVLYNLADTFFVSMVNDPIQNAAVTLAYPVLLAFNAFNNLFGVGASSMMSRAMGRHDYDTVRKSSAVGFYMALISAAVFALVCTVFNGPLMNLLGVTEETAKATGDYIFWTVSLGAVPGILNVVLAYLVRAEGASLHASIGTMSGCALNMILDPFFILPWGLNLGAAGAGMATCLANCFACLYFFALLWRKKKSTYVSVSPAMFKPNKAIVLGICGVGIPASIQNLLNVTGSTILNNFASGFGSDAVAAMGIAQKINMIPFQIAFGLSQGIMPLVSYNYASGNGKRMKNGFFYTTRISMTFIVLITAMYLIGANGLIRLFMDNDIVVNYGAQFLRGFCLGLPFLCMDFLAVGVFQACGLGRHALLFAILRKIVLEIPAIYILNWLFPLYGLAYSQLVAEVILAIAAICVLIKLFKQAETRSAMREVSKE